VQGPDDAQGHLLAVPRHDIDSLTATKQCYHLRRLYISAKHWEKNILPVVNEIAWCEAN
jgi:hypothetical protein